MITLLDELRACGDWFDSLESQHARLEALERWLIEEEQSACILPARGVRLNALRQTALADVKVVITGQDPYPGLDGDVPHAMGLSFSVPHGVKPPRSLVNIYKELEADVGLARPDHGDLSPWAAQGVLMLNSTLTLRQGEAASHAKKGWEEVSQAILSAVNRHPNPIAFLAWGKHSHKLVAGIDESRHQVIRTSHPSPLGATKAGAGFEAFLGSRCFSRVNDFLETHQRGRVDWCRL